jgi:hypothetical protein
LRESDLIAKPASSVLLLAAVAMLSLWPPLLAIAQTGTPPAEALADDEAVAEESTDAVADNAGADGNTVDGDLAVGDDANEDLLTSEAVPPEESFIERNARAFNESDLVFVRGLSNAPFLPVAFLGNTHYGDAMVSEEGATPETAGTRYSVNSTSQYAGVPFLLNKRSMVVLGEYVSYSNFSVDNGEDFSVASASLGAGYLYQVNDDWQMIGALVPFYHHSSIGERDKDYWQVMGGAVARYTRNDRLWWLFGVVFDDSDFGTSVLPYVGASLILNEHWSVSAILPWPQVMYAPSKDWFVSLGASYSGNSWAIDTGAGKVGLNLSGFDFGFGAGMRLKGPLWLEGAVGVGGLRALTINDGEVSGPSIDVSSSPFVNISLTFRPSFTD